MPDEKPEKPEDVMADLRRVRDAVREHTPGERPPCEVLPPAKPVTVPGPMPRDPAPEPGTAPPAPDAAELNRVWDAARLPTSLPGWRGLVLRLLRPLLAPVLERQVEFNSRQVQFDNALLEYVVRRFDLTHRHYDAVLGITGRHLGEIDERHLILQEELVAHVHDLVARIDLVLAESERGRVSLEFALQDVRARLASLEERLTRDGAPRPPSR